MRLPPFFHSRSFRSWSLYYSDNRSHFTTCTVTTLLRPRSFVMDRAYWPSGNDSGTENVMFLLSTLSTGNLKDEVVPSSLRDPNMEVAFPKVRDDDRMPSRLSW